MRKTYTYRAKKRGGKLIFLPLLLLFLVITIIVISNISSKKASASSSSSSAWVSCHHSDFKVNGINKGTGNDLGSIMIQIKCGHCDYTRTVKTFKNAECTHYGEEINSISFLNSLVVGYTKSVSKGCKLIVYCAKCNVANNPTFIEAEERNHIYDIEAACHSYSTCVICGETTGSFDTSKHLLSHKRTDIAELDETTGQHVVKEVCNSCSKTVTATVHNSTLVEWIPTSTHHYGKCSECDYITEKSLHSYANPTCSSGPKCTVCGYVYPNGSSDPDAHVDNDGDGICDLCGKTSECDHSTNYIAATCTTAKYCKDCKKYIGSPNGHKWNAATCTKPKTCSVCGATDGSANGHSYTQYEQYNFSTSSGGVGYHLLVCSDCGCKTSESCYKSKTEVATKPTCTTSGKWKYTCDKCKAYWYVTIPALGHDYDDNGNCTRCSAVKDTTCKHGKYKQHYDYTDSNICTRIRTCQYCGEVFTAEFSHTGGTHDNGGICTNCKGQYQNHNRTTGTFIRWESNETSHRTVLECYGCVESGDDGEFYTDWSEHYGGTHQNGGTCQACGTKYQEHNETDYYELISSTLHRKILECSCGETTITNETSSHTYYDNYVYARDNGNGTHSIRCKDCLGYAKTETHKYSEATCTTKPTCTVSGCKAQLDVEVSHVGGNHSNDGTCTKCNTKYQNHSQETSVDSYIQAETQHTPVYNCTFKDCTYKYNGIAENHNITTYKDNGNGTHSGICKTCNYNINSKHSYTNGVCTECNAQEPITMCEHNYVIKNNENEHWEECTKCSKKKEESTKKHTGATHANGGKCTTCSYVYQTHSKGVVKEYIKTESEHITVYTCSYSGCTETYKDTAEKHNITTYTDTGDGTHKGVCRDCSYEVSIAHTYSDGKCTVCNATEPKKDEQCEHTYVIKNDDNSHWEECSKCKNIKESTKTAHTISTWTDKQDGTHQGKCTVCQKVVTETHSNGTSGKCTKCSYDGTNNNDNNNGNNNNSDNNGNNNNSNSNNGSNNSGSNSGTTNKDDTTANGSIPQTGSNPIEIVILVGVIGIIVYTIIRMKILRDIK